MLHTQKNMTVFFMLNLFAGFIRFTCATCYLDKEIRSAIKTKMKA